MVCDLGANLAERHGQPGFDQELRDVSHLGDERTRPLGPGRVVLEKLVVLLQGGAAAGCVHDVVVGARSLERGDVPAREALGHAFLATVDVERTAAALATRDDDLAPVGGEHTHRGGVRLAEELGLNASLEHGDAMAARADGGRGLGKAPPDESTLRARHEALDPRQPRERPEDAQRADGSLQPRLLVGAHREAQPVEESARAKRAVEQHLPKRNSRKVLG